MKKAAAMGFIGCLLLAGCGTPSVHQVTGARNEIRPVTTGSSHALSPPAPPAISVTPATGVPVEQDPVDSVRPTKRVTAPVPVQPVQKPVPQAPQVPEAPNVQTANWGGLPPVRDKGKNVVLTFDDGPSPHTTQLIQTLDNNHVPAIFFWNTYHFQYATGEVSSLLSNSSDITIGDHTVDHPNMIRLGYDAQYNEIVGAQHTIEQFSGNPVVFYRPPYGNYNSLTQSVLKKAHLTLVLWNDDSLDWKYNSNESAILHEIRQELRPGAVILMHDHPYTIKFLPDIIAMIRSQGYGFTTLQAP